MLKQTRSYRAVVSYGGYPSASLCQVPEEALPVTAGNNECPKVPHLGGKSILAQLLKTKGLKLSSFGNTPGGERGRIWQSPFTGCSLIRASKQYCGGQGSLQDQN